MPSGNAAEARRYSLEQQEKAIRVLIEGGGGPGGPAKDKRRPGKLANAEKGARHAAPRYGPPQPRTARPAEAGEER